MADPGLRSLQEFLDCLDYVREIARQRLAPLKAAELDGTRESLSPDTKRVYTVRWILFHILEHEAHHKGQAGVS